jgi:hypothetical protein
MQTITIPKNEYKRLLSLAKAYQKLAGEIFKKVINDPIKDVVDDFRRTKLYTDEFLHDMEDGLKKSSYAKSKR